MLYNFEMNILPEILKKIVLFMIRIYQKLFSFDHSFWAKPEIIRICVFHPSCSEYTYQAIERFGIIKGSLLGLYRIIRCNPFSKGGIDEVPKVFSFRSSK
jgi:hypothetical protein